MDRAVAERIVSSLKWIDSVVSFVWIGLTGLMVYALYLLFRVPSSAKLQIGLVVAVILATWLYPVYTSGFELRKGLIANGFYLLLVAVTIGFAAAKSKVAAWALSPIVVWVILATVYTYAQLRLRT